jgi:anaerobic selenocysteine-containing dehydrogenase
MADEWAEYAGAMEELGAAPITLIPWSEAVHVADGSVSRNLYWSHQTVPDPKLYVSKEVAADLGIEKGDRVGVSAEQVQVVLPVVVTGKLVGGTVAATIHFPAVRKLFPWRLNGRTGDIVLGPIAVRLTKQSEK